MSFFDKKEEVIDLQLTPYGRHLLSQGKLKPAYYAFLDDDIIYDSAAAGFTESNHEVKERIINETPSTKAITTMNSVETTINEFHVEEIQRATNMTIEGYQNEYLNSYKPLSDLNSKFLQDTIGTSDPSKNKAPAWDVINLEGEIVKAARGVNSEVFSINSYVNDIDTPTLVQNIPQIEVEIEYNISRGSTSNQDEYQSYLDEARSANLPEPQPVNGYYLKIFEVY